MTNFFKRSTIFEIAILLLLAAALAFGTSFFIKPVIAEKETETSNDNIELIPIGIVEAEDLYDIGAIFIDIRPLEEYTRQRIKGAVHYSGQIQTPDANDLKRAVIYGSADDLELCLEIGQKVAKVGFGSVYIFLEGFSGWLDAGFEVEGSDVK